MVGEFNRNNEIFRRRSKEAQDLVSQLLNYDYLTRISAEEALKHPWFFLQSREKDFEIDDEYLNKALKNIKNFKVNNKLQLAGMAFIVHFIETNEEINNLIEVFKKMDRNGDGRLTLSDLHEGFVNVKGTIISERELMDTYKKLDQDKNGYIEYEEFIRASIDSKLLLSDSNLKLAFNYFDKNNDGKLNKEDLKQIFGTENNEYCIKLIQTIDQNNDGEISYEEFSILMKNMIKSNVKSKLPHRSKTQIDKSINDLSILTSTENKIDISKTYEANIKNSQLKNLRESKTDDSIDLNKSL